MTSLSSSFDGFCTGSVAIKARGAVLDCRVTSVPTCRAYSVMLFVSSSYSACGFYFNIPRICNIFCSVIRAVFLFHLEVLCLVSALYGSVMIS
jgi:hypothetical protein